MAILFIFISLLWLLISVLHFSRLLQYFQQHEYDNLRFLNWSLNIWQRVIRPAELFFAALLVLGASQPAVSQVVVLLLWAGALFAWFPLDRRNRSRVVKPLAYTARIKRLLGVGMVLLAGSTYFLTSPIVRAAPQWLTFEPLNRIQLLAALLAFGMLGQLTFVYIVLANLILYPIEETYRQYYIRSAKKILDNVKPVVIGITGSYGKTTTKELLGHLLAYKHDTLRTPKSYNTLMGICKVIREELQPRHKYFIVEMGAYKPGEIKKICKLVGPHIGILTAVGPQHLERFKTIENVAKAKNELMEALPHDGTAIFNGDDPICLRLAGKAHGQVYRYGLGEEPGLDLKAGNIKLDANGTQFEILCGSERLAARTRLLGRHNVSNALGALLAALKCGLTLKEAVQALAHATPFEHRLQLVRSQNDITYIDDAYNANPQGAKMALEALGAIAGGRKILVTPGFAELGPIEAAEHERLGQEAAAICDYIFLIGSQERCAQILKGINQHGYDPQHVFCYNTLNEAREKLKTIVLRGDVVLFENDLSDIYR